MSIRLTLQPHQRGAKQLLAKYGDRLLCVRYRYEAAQKKRLKTVELIVAERRWDPRRETPLTGQVVHIQVAASELAIRRQVKAAGGKWNPRLGVWELCYEQVVALSLETRIVPGPGSI